MDDLSKYNLTMVRTLDAPRETVFKAWTDAETAAKWWGPQGFTAPVSEVNARPGGAINIVMEDSAGVMQKGARFPMSGTFEEVVEPEKLVFTSQAVMNGQPILENRATVVFEETSDGKTKLTVTVVVTKATPEAAGPLSGMEMGWNQQLDKLVELYKG